MNSKGNIIDAFEAFNNDFSEGINTKSLCEIYYDKKIRKICYDVHILTPNRLLNMKSTKRLNNIFFKELRKQNIL